MTWIVSNVSVRVVRYEGGMGWEWLGVVGSGSAVYEWLGIIYCGDFVI